MKIAIAQIRSEEGDFKKNLETHKKWIEVAVANHADLVAFPELSLTGYEPLLAKKLATSQKDARLDILQEISDHYEITIAIGLPTTSESGVYISMIIFQPVKPRLTYSKQKLHEDERPYFIEGSTQLILKVKDNKIAPAICFEALQPDHAANAIKLGAEIYLASVAKSQKGVGQAYNYFPTVAKKYELPVLMANGIGYCDNFESAGQSAIWDKEGQLIAQLGSDVEGILIFDTSSGQVSKQT